MRDEEGARASSFVSIGELAERNEKKKNTSRATSTWRSLVDVFTCIYKFIPRKVHAHSPIWYIYGIFNVRRRYCIAQATTCEAHAERGARAHLLKRSALAPKREIGAKTATRGRKYHFLFLLFLRRNYFSRSKTSRLLGNRIQVLVQVHSLNRPFTRENIFDDYIFTLKTEEEKCPWSVVRPRSLTIPRQAVVQ